MLDAMLKAVRQRRSVVLAYHGVGPTDPVGDPDSLCVPPDAFRRQVDLLQRAGFELVTVAELVRRWGDAPVPPPGLAALSFDDGMADNHHTVLPILQAAGVPATIYVTTGLVGRPNPFMGPASGARMMTADELRDVHRAGFELGGHTVTHPDMERLDEEACFGEVDGSRRWLESLTGAPVETFAYPFCHFGPEAQAAVRRAGLRAAVTCHGRGGWDRWAMRREMVAGVTSLPGFALKVSGSYQALRDSPPGLAARRATRGVRTRVLRPLRRRG